MTSTEPPIDPRQTLPSVNNPTPAIDPDGGTAGATAADAATGAASHSSASQAPPQNQSRYIPPPTAPPKRLLRDDSGPVGGVATGIANYFALDPVIIQIAFAVLTVAGGSGICLYLAGWLLIPKASDPSRMSGEQRPGVIAVGIGSLFLIGAVAALVGGLSFGVGGSGGLFWIILIGGGIYLLSQRQTDAAPAPAPAPAPGSVLVDSHAWGIPHATPQEAAAISVVAARPTEPDLPPITSITLGLAAVGVGLLAILSQATDLDVGGRSYFGLVAAFCGAGLVVASVKGRAWALVPIGLLAVVLLPVAPAFDHLASGGFGAVERSISSMEDLDHSYELAAGEQILDLRTLTLTEDATLEVATSLGSTRIIVPTDMQLDVNATTDAGSLTVFDQERKGTNLEITRVHPAHSDQGHASEDGLTSGSGSLDESEPILTINIEVVFGEVTISHDR